MDFLEVCRYQRVGVLVICSFPFGCKCEVVLESEP